MKTAKRMTQQQERLAMAMIATLDELYEGFYWAFSPKDNDSCWLECFMNSQRYALMSFDYPSHGFDVIVPKDLDIDTITVYQNNQDEEESATLGFTKWEDLKEAMIELYEQENRYRAAGMWCNR